MVGRLVGKGGEIIKSIMKESRCMVKVVDEEPTKFCKPICEVRIIGLFFNRKYAKQLVKNLMANYGMFVVP